MKTTYKNTGMNEKKVRKILIDYPQVQLDAYNSKGNRALVNVLTREKYYFYVYAQLTAEECVEACERLSIPENELREYRAKKEKRHWELLENIREASFVITRLMNAGKNEVDGLRYNMVRDRYDDIGNDAREAGRIAWQLKQVAICLGEQVEKTDVENWLDALRKNNERK